MVTLGDSGIAGLYDAVIDPGKALRSPPEGSRKTPGASPKVGATYIQLQQLEI